MRRQYNIHNHQRQSKRRVRALSEFLEPPPMVPVNFGSSPSTSMILTIQPTLTSSQQNSRIGRYAHNQPKPSNYLSKIMNWLNPFDNDDTNDDVDSVKVATTDYRRIAQYAPQQP